MMIYFIALLAILGCSPAVTEILVQPSVEFDVCQARNEFRGLQCQLPASEAPFTISVLTMDRPSSLRILLNSLAEAEYDGEKIDVIINIDYPHKKHKKEDWLEVMRLASEFKWPFGDKFIRRRWVNAGLLKQWTESFDRLGHDSIWDVNACESDEPSASLLCSQTPQWNSFATYEELRHGGPILSWPGVILEDDMEVSPFWFLWVRCAIDRYGDRHDINGISLGTPMACMDRAGQLINGDNPFMHRVFGSWGYVPYGPVFSSFRLWMHGIEAAYPHFLPTVPDHPQNQIFTPPFRRDEISPRKLWSPWFAHFIYMIDTYTLYPPVFGVTLAQSHRALGLHTPDDLGMPLPLMKALPKEFLQFPDCLYHIQVNDTCLDCALRTCDYPASVIFCDLILTTGELVNCVQTNGAVKY
eukprot:Rmarinus@m.1014